MCAIYFYLFLLKYVTEICYLYFIDYYITILLYNVCPFSDYANKLILLSQSTCVKIYFFQVSETELLK